MPDEKKRDYQYSFPSQMKSNIRHNRRVLLWSVLFGLIVAALFGLIIWYANRPPRGSF